VPGFAGGLKLGDVARFGLIGGRLVGGTFTPFFVPPFANPALYLLRLVIIAHHRLLAVDTSEPFYFRRSQKAPVTPFAPRIVRVIV
jgi:hypothetical protein